jgi:Cu/Ag efflux pump CusA
VTFPIEAAVNGAAGVRRVRSATAVGLSIVWIEFGWGTDIYAARQIVSEKVNVAAGELPPEVDRPVLAPVSSIMGEILFISLTSDKHTPIELRTTADTVIRRRLLSVPGVSQVTPIGGGVKQFQVLLSPAKLQFYGVSLNQVTRTLAEGNENVSAGFINERSSEWLITGVGRVRSLEDIRETVVKATNGIYTKVGDLGEVVIGEEPKRGDGSTRGKPAVILGIQKQPGANTLMLTKELDAVILVENVFRRLREKEHEGLAGETLIQSQLHAGGPRALHVVFDASIEIQKSIVFATLIIALVFLPIFFLSGVEGRLLKPLGIAYIVSLGASLLVALTVSPVLCHLLLPSSRAVQEGKEPKVVTWLKSHYARILTPVLAHPWRVTVPAAVALLLALGSTFFMGRSFLPQFNEGTLTLSAVTLSGTSLEQANEYGNLIERTLLAHPEVTGVARRQGRAELDEHAQGVESAEIDVSLKMQKRSKKEFLEALRRDFSLIPGMNIIIGQPISRRIDHMLSGSRANVAVKIFGENLYQLRLLAEKARQTMQTVPGVVDPLVAKMPGYRVDYGGQFESAAEASQIIVLLGIAVVIGIGFLLHLAFGSGRDAALIMLNLPLALIGGVVGVFVSGGVLSVASLIGFISVFGIATRNGIMLVSHVKHLEEHEGVTDLREAVFRGAMERLAPILMTALAAGLALIPLALGGHKPASEIQTPMATVILFGLLTSMLLNMIVVPALYLRFGKRN